MFPFVVHTATDLDRNWHRFRRENDYDRSFRENVWRRHQAKENKDKSSWGEDGTARRRLLLFQDKYELVGQQFRIASSLIHVAYKSPKQEIYDYVDKLRDFALLGGWTTHQWYATRDNLNCLLIVNKDQHPFEYGRTPDWMCLDVVFTTRKLQHVLYSGAVPPRTYNIFKLGIRKTTPAGRPNIIGVDELKRFFPAQVTIGCGPSIEAGIPPLNYLHKVYGLNLLDGKFVLKPQDDDFVTSLLKEPEKKYEEMSEIHKKCLLAEPTPFHHALKRLSDQKALVGPVITNNFDGLCLSVGLEELAMRKYDKDGIYPEIDFHPAAKSLFVIGSHADRRGVEACARERGLEIVYIDPCGYDDNGSFTPYPLESPQDKDYLVQVPADSLSSL